jgi:hypothetical protein
MTFIQPTKHTNLFNFIIAVLVITILGGTFWLVVAYNKTVNLSHDIVSSKAELDALGASSTALNNSIISTLGGVDFQTVAAADGLVADKNPQYFQLDQNGLSLLNNR